MSETMLAVRVKETVLKFVVQSISHVLLFATAWLHQSQSPLSSTVSRSLLKFLSIEPVMPYNHLILCRPLLFLLSIFPSIWVFSNELALRIRWPKYWRFSISPSNDAVVNWLCFVLLINCYSSQDIAILHPHLGPASLGHKFHCDANDSSTKHSGCRVLLPPGGPPL